MGAKALEKTLKNQIEVWWPVKKFCKKLLIMGETLYRKACCCVRKKFMCSYFLCLRLFMKLSGCVCSWPCV